MSYLSNKEALVELEKYAKDFTNVGDEKQAIKANENEFNDKFNNVLKYYKYIMNNYKEKPSLDEMIEASSIVSDISIDNPSLEEWVEAILNPREEKKEQEQEQKKEQDYFDPASISGPIESLITEIKSMHNWDPEHAEDLGWELRGYRTMLESHENEFSEGNYNSLMNDIDNALNSIEIKNNMINNINENYIQR